MLNLETDKRSPVAPMLLGNKSNDRRDFFLNYIKGCGRKALHVSILRNDNIVHISETQSEHLEITS